MSGPYSWDVAVPPADQSRRLGDDALRSLKAEWLRAMQDGPMSLFPATPDCTPGWPVPFLYTTLVGLQANTPTAPYGRIGIVTSDGANNGLWVELLATGWTKVNGT
jgi:hypothetical protein